MYVCIYLCIHMYANIVCLYGLVKHNYLNTSLLVYIHIFGVEYISMQVCMCLFSSYVCMYMHSFLLPFKNFLIKISLVCVLYLKLLLKLNERHLISQHLFCFNGETFPFQFNSTGSKSTYLILILIESLTKCWKIRFSIEN